MNPASYTKPIGKGLHLAFQFTPACYKQSKRHVASLQQHARFQDHFRVFECPQNRNGAKNDRVALNAV